jgi:tRNA/tmRNA/rRNA uracil-C5-methylase (TrmA/RlmC/RlmD family)
VNFHPGQVLAEVLVGPVAHGGHFVARHDGRVIFVRGALSGELVDVRITEVAKRFARGETVAVRQASQHRIEPVCPVAGICGGCDFQHTTAAHSRELKRQVVAEQLAHLGGYEFTGEVAEVVPGDFGWRTRMRYHFDESGRPGLLAPRSPRVVRLPEEGCRLAVAEIAAPRLTGPPAAELIAVAADDQVVFAATDEKPVTVTQKVGARSYEVGTDGFWQAHLRAPEVLTEAVLAGLNPLAGEVAADLYCGVGLFAGALADVGCTVFGIEGDRRAVEFAAQNVPEADFRAGDVAKLADRLPTSLDLVVLDPPRAGVGAAVLPPILARRPRAVAYVACDPAALGRDLGIAAKLGYRTVSVQAFDLFPTTGQVECVAILKPE